MGKQQILVGTARGLYQFGAAGPIQLHRLGGHDVVAITRDGARWWAIIDGRTLRRTDEDGSWTDVAGLESLRGTCLAPTARGLLVGTEGAHLVRVGDGALERVESFEHVDGRSQWYTPWGEPPDVRSLSTDGDGVIYANVHVGGIVRSTDGGASWRPTIDIETDVHQVLAHPERPGVVLAATAVGLGVSNDGGDSWQFTDEGLHARYLRAVAVSEERVLVAASTGPGGKRAAVYWRWLDKDEPFVRCREGLPEWFRDNIDTAWLAASGAAVAIGTADGSVFSSTDSGEHWDLIARELHPIRCLIVG